IALCGLVRGADAGSREPLAWVTASRGSVVGWQDFAVVGASTPGPFCTVEARWIGSAAAVTFHAPAGACPLAQGQRVRVRVPCSRSPPLPGGAPRSVGGSFRVDGLWPLDRAADPYWSWVAGLRQRAWEITRGDDARSFLAASLLGLRQALPPATRESLRAAGLGHLIAVSGLHVGIAALLFQRLLVGAFLRLRAPLVVGVVASFVPIVAYVGLTGAAAPAVRAALMYAWLSLATVAGRPVHGLHALAVAVTAMLAVDPSWAADPGFQLSVAAMGAILCAPPRVSLFEQTWRIAWALLPLSLLHFQQTNAYGLLANLVAVPLFTVWIAPVGALGWMLVPWCGSASLEPAAWGADIVLFVAAELAEWPPLSRAGVLLLAGAGLLLHVVGTRRWPALRRALPSPWILLASAGSVVLFTRGAPVRPPGDWWVVGTPRRATTIVIDAEGRACLDDPIELGA